MPFRTCGYVTLRIGRDHPSCRCWAILAGDTSPGELVPEPCETGPCHLGGPRIPDAEAYGAGLVNVATP